MPESQNPQMQANNIVAEPRLVRVEGDNMEPTLRRGDFVIMTPCQAFRCDGLYVFERGGEVSVYRCQADLKGNVCLRHDNKQLVDHGYSMPLADFNAKVAGTVAALVNVIDGRLFEAGLGETNGVDRDAFALGGRDAAIGEAPRLLLPAPSARADGDAAILALFAEWQAAAELTYPEDDNDAAEKQLARLAEIEERLWTTPALGPIGLAIKAYALAYVERGPAFDGGSLSLLPLGAMGGDYRDDGNLSDKGRVLRGLMADIARVVPELAPHALVLTRAPLALPAAAVPAAPSSGPAPPWRASPAPAGDAELLSLFRQWCACNRTPGSGDDDEADKVLDAQIELERRIFDMAATGAVGLAIKTYFVGFYCDDIRPEDGDPCVLSEFPAECYSRRLENTATGQWSDDAWLYLLAHALRGALASAAAALPELQPLVAPAIASPLTVPFVEDDDDDDEGGDEDDGVDGDVGETERTASIRRRIEALVASCSGPLAAGDAGLIEAERRQAQLADGRERLKDEFEWDGDEERVAILPAWDPADSEISAYILNAEPQGLLGVLAQLRYLCRYPGSDSPELLADWLAIIERCAGIEAGGPHAAK